MASGTPQDPQIRPIRTLAELHRGAVPDQVTAEDAQREAWRRVEIRYYGGRVDELERRLRRRTWILGCALVVSTVLAIPTLLQFLLPDLKPRTTAAPAAPADNTAPIKPAPVRSASPDAARSSTLAAPQEQAAAPIPMLSAPEPTTQLVEPLRRPTTPKR